MSRTVAFAKPRSKSGAPPAPARTPRIPPSAGLCDTMKKVDRAVARLEELQSLIRESRPENRSARPPVARAPSSRAPPPPPPRKPVHRAPRIPPPSKPTRHQSPRRKAAPPSPPSACSTSAAPLRHQRQQRRPVPPPPPPQPSSSPVAPKTKPRISDASASKLPKTFVVDTNSAHSNPNRPWCLSSASSSLSQSMRSSAITTTTATTTTSTSNDYVYTSRSTTCTRRSTLSRRSLSQAAPPRYSYGGPPLAAQPQQTQLGLQIDPADQEFCAEARPLLQDSRFSRRLSLPVAAAPPEKPSRRFSLIPSKKKESSPPDLPLPALITRLPARRNINHCNNAHFNHNGEDDDAVDSPKPLPLPPSLAGRSREFPLQPLPSVRSPARQRRQSISGRFSDKENRLTATCFPADQLLHSLKSASARWSRRSSWSSALCHITNDNDDGGSHNLLGCSCLRSSAPRSPPPLSASCSVPFVVKHQYKPWSVYKVDSPQPQELGSSCRRKSQLYMG